MTKRFRIGDHVAWNSEAGRVRGRITRVHTRDTNWHGYVHHASAQAPQYEIKSDTTDHVALHKVGALTRRRASPARGKRASKTANKKTKTTKTRR